MDGAGFDFAAGEDRDGIRLTWNEWPSSKLDATIASVPVAAVCVATAALTVPSCHIAVMMVHGCHRRGVRRYSPFKLLPAMPAHFEYEPVRCKQAKCGAVLNPFWCVRGRVAAGRLARAASRARVAAPVAATSSSCPSSGSAACAGIATPSRRSTRSTSRRRTCRRSCTRRTRRWSTSCPAASPRRLPSSSSWTWQSQMWSLAT